MALRVNRDSVSLDFERTLPLAGRLCRTKYSQRGAPPYFELLVEDGKAQMVVVDSEDAVRPITDMILLRDMSRVLEGMRLHDFIQTSLNPAGDAKTS